MVAGVFFYIFSVITIASALMVITVRNPVHAVLFLILAFFNSAGLFVLLGAEFLAMILVVVYVGAVIMMLDVDFAEMRAGFVKYLPIGAAIGIVLLVELTLVIGAWSISDQSMAQRANPIPGGGVTNTEALGAILYTDYVYFFELAGVILLVAMIGAIDSITVAGCSASSKSVSVACTYRGGVGSVGWTACSTGVPSPS